MSYTKEEIRLQVALSCIQGVIEAKHGVIGMIIPQVAVIESLRIADAFVEEWFRGADDQSKKDDEKGD